MMQQDIAALKIQGFFKTYRLKKQQVLQEVIDSSSSKQLLEALDLRFQCMRAVAAAKLPLGKPINDKAQIEKVLVHVRELANEKEIKNVEMVANLFLQNITLAENIQSPYYDVIWKCHYGQRDFKLLVNNAYMQLRQIVSTKKLPIACNYEKTDFTSEEVLLLARDIIQHASQLIIEALGNSDLHEYYQNSQHINSTLRQMLANYMTPSALIKCTGEIDSLAGSIKRCTL